MKKLNDQQKSSKILFSQTEMDPYFEGKTCQTYSADYSYADCDADYVRHKIDAVCGRSFKPLWMFSSLKILLIQVTIHKIYFFLILVLKVI